VSDGPAELLARARACGPTEARALLRDALGRGSLGPLDVAAAGRQARRLGEGDESALEVLFLAEVTTRFLADVTAAWCLARGLSVRVVEADFDQVVQGAAGAAAGGAAVLVPGTERVGETAPWEAAWALLTDRRLVQVGWDLPGVGPSGVRASGDGGPVAQARAGNAALRAGLPTGAWFVDAARVAGDLGRRQFYDPRQLHWVGQPWSPAGVSELGRHIAAGLQALVTGPRKVLVLDLDNTLWGGIVGEAGGRGVVMGPGTPEGRAFASFQAWCKGLRDQGVLLAACSRNDPDAARSPFEEHPEMLLSLDDFSAFEASWDPKPRGLERIADQLGLALDAMVFVDDNPAEREAVRQALPQVAVVELPDDPAGYVRAIEAGLWFEALPLTDEDRLRAQRYRAEGRRESTRQRHAQVEGWLASLEMVGEARALNEGDLDRAVQLVARTSQFNLTTRRHGREHLAELLADPGGLTLTLRLRDRFGDHGLVGVVLAAESGRDLIVDTLLLSCRVIGRTAEHFLLAAVVHEARRRGLARIVGEYQPTPRNGLVAGLWAALGATPLAETGRWALPLEPTPAWPTFVTAAP
jgi:FkbH-like protein